MILKIILKIKKLIKNQVSFLAINSIKNRSKYLKKVNIYDKLNKNIEKLKINLMKDELIKILIWLHDNDSWDLAEIFAKWLYNNTFRESYIESILWFLTIASRLTQDTTKQENLKNAITKLQQLRKQERQEKENENPDEMLKELF